MINTIIIVFALFFLSFLVCFVACVNRAPIEEGNPNQVIPIDSGNDHNISKAS